MIVNLANTSPVNEEDPGNQKWLEKLQGNILAGHGRTHSAHLLLRLPEKQEEALAIIRSLVPYVTSARQQYIDSKEFRESKGQVSGKLFGGLSLSASGYQKLRAKAMGGEGGAWSKAGRFLAGMRCPFEPGLEDPPPDQWEEPYRCGVDAMLLLAHARASTLRAAVRLVIKRIGPSNVASVEWGRVFRNRAGEPIEHFGFVDGRSQPLFLMRDFKVGVSWPHTSREERDGRPIDAWNPFASLGTVLLVDPLGGGDDCLGSFLVFRKLEQNVRRFVGAERALACQLRLRGASRRRAGALIVGRFRDGAALTCASERGWQPTTDNNFTYQEDREGWRCPLYAHVRRANPRGSSVPGLANEAFIAGLASELPHRITRRGVTYGPPTRGVAAALTDRASDEAVSALPSGGVGVLFMAYQADIEQQFAFMQRVWFSSFFLGAGVPLDILSGRAQATQAINWPDKHNGGTITPQEFPACVRMRGGEYFFTPSLPFLRRL